MMDATPLWQFLEARARLAAVMAEWHARLDGCFDAVQPLLKATGESAGSYPDRRCPGRMLHVVRHRDGTVVAVSTEDPDIRVDLTESDLAVFAIDWNRLRDGIADALGLARSRAPLVGNEGVVPVGRWEPKPAAAFPVVLVRGHGRQQVRELIHTQVATSAQPMLVLTPTRRYWTDEITDLCRQFKCITAPLDDAIAVEDTSFIASEHWRDYIGAFCGYAKLTLPANFANKRPPRKRAERAAKIESVRNELVLHIRAARDHAYSAIQRGDEPELLRRPNKSKLAELAGLKPYDLTRCFNDEPQLKQLWNMADDLDAVMNFGR